MIRWGTRTVHLADGREVPVQRYSCRRCRRTMRLYPPGVVRGKVDLATRERIRRLLYTGLGALSVSRALQAEGVKLSLSTVWRVGKTLREVETDAPIAEDAAWDARDRS